MGMSTSATETRAPGVRCPQCGRYLGDVRQLVSGGADYRCHGYTITVSRETR